VDLKKLEQQINTIIKSLEQDNAQSEFIYEFLRAYDFPNSSITRLKKGDYNQSKNTDEILWKKNIFFKVENQQDLHLVIDEAQKDKVILKHNPRFIIVTDFKTLLAVDTKVGDSLDISLDKLSENYAFFLPWAGMEKTQIENLQLADRKAAERLAQLYDIIIQDNHIETNAERHGLNVFLSRLLFCFFAEDTGIFDEGQFTSAIASHTHEDGSDCQDYLNALFKVLNVKHRTNEPQYLKEFPYVNGGLFAADHPAPKLNAKARKLMINSGTLNWKEINPDIFGSMMQAVVHSDQRGSLGMHYTSVANIMKVIEPLFLNDIKQQLTDCIASEKGIENKLTKLLDRLYHLRLFDPACGSGNFLIIAYKELCKVEIDIFEQLRKINPDKWNIAISGIQLTQFYGIELDDFAHETAKLSLWLAEHQMNLAFKFVFGSSKPTLPLQEGGHIICGNATRLDWEVICPKDAGAEIYIMGNPPYLGSRYQTITHKEDIAVACNILDKYKKVDYIICWFLKAGSYVQSTNHAFAFVSTNSICQGEQVELIWPYIFNIDLEIFFAHQSFKWTNNAKGNAGVTCIIIGIQDIKNKQREKYIYNGNLSLDVKNINAYLALGGNTVTKKRTKPLSNFPKMESGNKATDDGNLLLSEQEKNSFLITSPDAKEFIKNAIGAFEFLNGGKKFCLWITDEFLKEALKIPDIKSRIEKVKSSRLASSKKNTQLKAETPHKFDEIRFDGEVSFFIPTVSSERGEYIPIGYLNPNEIILAPNQAIYNPPAHIFAIISSRIHMTWVRAVAGRLETRIRYSSALCYNTFPFPEITEAQKATLEERVFEVLDEREQHSEKTMAELYDPDKMPDALRQAHHEMDLAVEQCYRKKPFKSDEERLEYLFKLYEEMIATEKKGE